MLSLQQAICPYADGGHLAPRITNDRRCADNEEMPQIAVSHLRYPAHLLFAPGGVLPGREPEPGSKLSARAEHLGVSNSGCQCGGRDKANAWDSFQPPA